MSSEREIRMNFNEAKRQAEKLEDVARRMERIGNSDMENSMQSLSGGWQGDNAKFFMSKEKQLKQNVLDTARELEEIARSIRSIAQRIYNAEMRALEIARERK